MQHNDMTVNVLHLRTDATQPEMPWNWLRQATGIATLRGEAATRSEQATGGSQ
jgi:hypothetical protein